MTKKAIWLPLGLVAAVAVALTALSAPSAQAGGGATVSVSTVTCAPGSTTCTVDVTVTPDAGVIVGALDLQIDYTNTIVNATSATPATCNPAFDADTIACSFADIAGLTGVEGTVTFTVLGVDGDSSPLTLSIQTCSDDTGAPITCTPVSGAVNVSQATPTPTAPPATPTPVGGTATPVGTAGAGTATPTPAGLPPTGGDSGSSSTLPLLLGALGAAALVAGAWAVTRLRRVSA
jgi:hypothetical protein